MTAPCALAPLPPAAAQLQQRARRVAMPCGAGEMVWHVWGEAPGCGRQAPPLVLLHGGSGSWTHWVRNIAALAEAGRAVWAADLPGFGDSAAPPCGSDAAAVAAPLAQALDRLSGGAGCDLVGFSFGALVAALLAATQPALARQLVLVGAPAMGVAPARQVGLRGWRHLPAAQQAQAHRFNLAALMLSDAALIDADQGLALALHTANVHRDRLPRRRRAPADALARTLAQVRCPVHAIHGRGDALYGASIGALQDAYARAAPDFRGLELIDGAGHWVQFEQPRAFHQALLAALDGGGAA